MTSRSATFSPAFASFEADRRQASGPARAGRGARQQAHAGLSLRGQAGAIGIDIAVIGCDGTVERSVRPGAQRLEISVRLPRDVERPGAFEAVVDALRGRRCRREVPSHAIAYASGEDLHGRVIGVSTDRVARAVPLRGWSFLRMPTVAEPHRTVGGVPVTMSDCEADEAVRSDTILGPPAARGRARPGCAFCHRPVTDKGAKL